MKAELKHLHSPDVDLRKDHPKQDGNFSFLIQAMIGPEGSEASESFDIVVCTPTWLSEHCHEPQWGRHLLIVPHYDIERIRQTIASYCSSCTGESWEKIAALLSRIGRWEFEGYRE